MNKTYCIIPLSGVLRCNPTASETRGRDDRSPGGIENCTGSYGPHENDTLLRGTHDILEFGGSETGSNTVIEFKRKMNTGDKFDKAFVPGQQVPIIWAMADTTDNTAKHNIIK